MSRLFELYIFLYSAIHEEDTVFRWHISTHTCQRVEIRYSRNAGNSKCQELTSLSQRMKNIRCDGYIKIR
ncbi:hypothetical protein DXC10_09945 [Bacteroides sp. OM08-11]|nr:hypothetical protein DXC10_09945 [Bacteroides sp. OM08-11]